MSVCLFFFKQKTAYEMRISDWSSDVCSSDLIAIYSLGLAIGTFLALSLGGFLNDQFGWRMTLFIIGATGIVLCVLVLTTVREPVRETAATGTRELPKGDISSLLRKDRKSTRLNSSH